MWIIQFCVTVLSLSLTCMALVPRTLAHLETIGQPRVSSHLEMETTESEKPLIREPSSYYVLSDEEAEAHESRSEGTDRSLQKRIMSDDSALACEDFSGGRGTFGHREVWKPWSAYCIPSPGRKSYNTTCRIYEFDGQKIDSSATNIHEYKWKVASCRVDETCTDTLNENIWGFEKEDVKCARPGQSKKVAFELKKLGKNTFNSMLVPLGFRGLRSAKKYKLSLEVSSSRGPKGDGEVPKHEWITADRMYFIDHNKYHREFGFRTDTNITVGTIVNSPGSFEGESSIQFCIEFGWAARKVSHWVLIIYTIIEIRSRGKPEDIGEHAIASGPLIEWDQALQQ